MDNLTNLMRMDLPLWIFIPLIIICIPHGGDGIYNGEQANISDFTYLAKLLVFKSSGLVHCGGVIIDEFHILTAAHCVGSIEPEKILISVGASHLKTSSLLWEVDQIRVHPHFEPAKTLSCMDAVVLQLSSCILGPAETKILPKNDIAVLKTLQIIPLGESITKINLPESDSLPYCQELRYAAWGHIEESISTDRLQCTTLIIIEQAECVAYFGQPREEHLCAVTANGISSVAPGDSGSPLIYNNIVYGITSFSYDQYPDEPTGFTKVFFHKDFIENARKPQRLRI